MASRSYFCEEPNPNEGETYARLVLSGDGRLVHSCALRQSLRQSMRTLELEPPPEDASQKHEAELEEQKFQRSLNIKPSKLVT